MPNGVTTFRDAVRGARVLRRHPRRPQRQGVHPRRRVGACGSSTSTSTCRSTSRRSTRPVRCSARARSSSWTTPPTWSQACWRIVRFFARECCGKCTPCREGTTWLERILQRILDGHGRPERPRPADRRLRQHQPGHRLAAAADDDLPARPVGGVARSPRRCARFRDEFEHYIEHGRRSTASSATPSTEVAPCLTRRADVDRTKHRRRRATSRSRSTAATTRRSPGELRDRRRARRRHLRPALLLPPAHEAGRHVPACASSRSTAGRGPTLGRRCMTTVAEGMRSCTPRPPTVKKAQEGVLEFLLANHPLDCPVCDKGGECPLQDQTLSHGPGESRFVEEKRHFEKPIPISDLVLPRPRALHPLRPLHPLRRRGRRRPADPASPTAATRRRSSRSPTSRSRRTSAATPCRSARSGALTAKPYRFKARPWDLEQVESTCTTCSVGCRIAVQSSRDELLRYQGVDSDPVNWGWLCDKGRFDFEAVEQRATASARRWSAQRRRARRGVVGDRASTTAADADPARRSPTGGPRAVARHRRRPRHQRGRLRVGQAGQGRDRHRQRRRPARRRPAGRACLGLPRATIDEACAAATRRAARPRPEGRAARPLPAAPRRRREARRSASSSCRRRTPVSPATPWQSLRHRPGEQAALAVLATSLGRLDRRRSSDAARQLPGTLVVVVAGRGNLADDRRRRRRRGAPARSPGHVPVGLRRATCRGALDMGLAPGLLPGGTRSVGALPRCGLRGARPASRPRRRRHPRGRRRRHASAAWSCSAPTRSPTSPTRDLARRALAGAGTVIAVDTFLTESSRQADVVLAAAGFAEKAGTTTNLEGRVSPLAQKVTPPGTARAGLDDRRRARRTPRRRPRLRLGRGDQRPRSRRSSPASRRHDRAPRSAADRDGVLLRGSPATDVAARPTPAHRHAAADALRRCAWSSSRKLYDGGVAIADVAVPGRPGAGAACCTCNPLDLDRLGVADGTAVQVSRRPHRVTLPVRSADAGVPRGPAVARRSTSPRSAADRPVDAGAPSPTSAWRRLRGALGDAAHARPRPALRQGDIGSAERRSSSS